MERVYKVLSQQVFEEGDYKLVPIRHEDRYDIMKWRNEQIYHLRQAEPLTEEMQDRYFDDVVSNLFKQEFPDQVLFSYLHHDQCVGYGGLVHINWLDRNAEVSFILSTEREKTQFQSDWKMYLSLLDYIAHFQLDLHKIFTYAFDVRPNLYLALESSGFVKEAVLREHCLFEGKYLDAIIHAKYFRKIELNEATEGHLEITYKWAVNPVVRKYSFNKEKITFLSHRDWFFNKLKDTSSLYKIATYNKEPVGSFRLEVNKDGVGLISLLLDPKVHGMGLGKKLLEAGVELAQKKKNIYCIIGEVMVNNRPSIKAFDNLGFDRTSDDGQIIKYQLRVE